MFFLLLLLWIIFFKKTAFKKVSVMFTEDIKTDLGAIALQKRRKKQN